MISVWKHDVSNGELKLIFFAIESLTVQNRVSTERLVVILPRLPIGGQCHIIYGQCLKAVREHVFALEMASAIVYNKNHMDSMYS